MTDDPVPSMVRGFILKHIDSVAQLEALLLMHSNPANRWDAKTMSQRIYTSEPEAAALLARLFKEGFLTVNDGNFQYHCTDEALRDLVEKLAEIYSRHLIPVTNLIHTKPRRIRQFADAFKFRRER